MATYAAIPAIGQALLGLLKQSCPKPEFANASFELYQANNFKKPMEEGISLFLYRVTPSTARRNLPGRVDAKGRRFRRPLALDLHYLLTPWARTAAQQHKLLGWALRFLEDNSSIPANVLNHFGLQGTDPFLPDESVTLVFDPLGIQDFLNVWEVGKPNLQVSATYLVRLIAIDSTVVEEEHPPVGERDVRQGRPGES
ncbi:MAG TPA: DUF4255 domain-containing protein [Archangium sp.]|uniref:DUF4255 domain-containing protein n=1 Tax=Archangium sp. TaxID=1872627 RepID=UPI002E33E48A|nr:DUF4255 domain-containing protein [Archangium sp.]HEX5749552.1 DUF4255 domain-containing protein [Archangium sp.]